MLHSPTRQPIRLLIADDQPRIRRSLEALLTAMRWSSPGHPGCSLDVVGEADSGQQVVRQVRALHPDVVVMDLAVDIAESSMPALDGLAAIRIIKRSWPAVRIVVLTMYATSRAAALAAGADAFLLKGGPASELLEAVMPPAL
jgi:DNA-binding NarL/FixJ family response regulator